MRAFYDRRTRKNLLRSLKDRGCRPWMPVALLLVILVGCFLVFSTPAPTTTTSTSQQLWSLPPQPPTGATAESPVVVAPVVLNDAPAQADYKCGIAVAVGTDPRGTRSLLANLYSIMENYKDDRNLCLFVFSTPQDFELRKATLNCAFADLEIANNIRILPKIIRKDAWYPRIFSANTLGRSELNSDYNWFRYYLKPSDVGGLSKIVWWDTDTICRGNIAEFYDWDMKGYAVAGATNDQPLKEHLCREHKEELKKIPMTKEKLSPLKLKWNLNAGILLMDLEELDKQHVLEKWNQLLIIHEKTCLWKLQQGAFTLAINGLFEELPEEWNHGHLGGRVWFEWFYGTEKMNEHIKACRHAKGLHWSGPDKPWDMWQKKPKKAKPFFSWKKEEAPKTEALCPAFWRMYDIVYIQNKEQCVPIKPVEVQPSLSGWGFLLLMSGIVVVSVAGATYLP